MNTRSGRVVQYVDPYHLVTRRRRQGPAPLYVPNTRATMHTRSGRIIHHVSPVHLVQRRRRFGPVIRPPNYVSPERNLDDSDDESSSSDEDNQGIDGGGLLPFPIPNNEIDTLDDGDIAYPPRIHMFDRGADGTGEEFREVIEEEMNAMRGDQPGNFMPLFLAALRNLRTGYAIDGEVFEGLSIREVKDLAVTAGLTLNQLYITGWGYQLSAAPASAGMTATRGVTSYIQADRKQFTAICLNEIDWPVYLETVSMTGSEFINWMMINRETFAAGSPQSDVASWILYGDIRLERRRRYSALQLYRFRTAGFDKLLPWDIEEELWFDGKKYEVYIPGGIKNCVHACVIWSIYKNSDDEYQRMVVGQRLDKVASIQQLTDWFDEYIRFFKRQYIEQRMNNSKRSMHTKGYVALRNKISSEFDSRVKHGYSSILLKRLFTSLVDHNHITMHVGSFDCLGNVQRGWNDYENYLFSLPLDSRPEYSGCMLRVLSDGQIARTGTESGGYDLYGESASSSNLAHGVAVHPVPRFTGQKLKDFFHSVQHLLMNRFKESIGFSDVGNLNMETALRLPDLIVSQNERKNKLIEERQKYCAAVDRGVGDAPNAGNKSFYYKRCGVLVYDIETVENLCGAHGDGRVYEPFRKETPVIDDEEAIAAGLTPDMYNIPQTQIPYSVQWGVVDLAATHHVDARYGGVEQGTVHIEFGDNLLGKCVDDFIEKVGKEGERRGGKNGFKWFAYAHNGCGFDAYIIKAYNSRFPVKKVLITPRGILSMTIQAAPKVDLILRDTKVFFQARLFDLCKVFNIPEKFCKTDFPITKVNVKNYADPALREAYYEYLVNDVYSLALIVKGVNEVIQKMNIHAIAGEGESVGTTPPPIAQFVTLMSAVKRKQRDLFIKELRMIPPIPVDIPAIRKWIQYGNIGGRVTPYWRGYASKYASKILALVVSPANDDRQRLLQSLYSAMKEGKNYMQVEDVTSLYPWVMTLFPMPCLSEHDLKYIDPGACKTIVSKLDCKQCRKEWTLCRNHRFGGDDDIQNLGFCFILVKDMQPPRDPWRGRGYVTPPLNLCPRKMSPDSKSGGGLIYSLQTTEELEQWYGEKKWGAVPEVQCYSHYDLFWMKKCGYKYEIVGGFMMETSYAFRDYTLSLFKKRIEAKKMEKEQSLPKSLSTFYKLFYNGGYGVNAQKDISENYIISDGLDEGQLRSSGKLKADEVIVRDSGHTHLMPNGQWLLKVSKDPNSCEYFADQSPNHIGAAVVSTARFYMNLAMYDQMDQEGLVSYTDTDSVAIHAIAKDKFMPAAIYNEASDAPMGTYKNDHELGKDEIIFTSFILTKKVKMHGTIDALGDIRFYPTFKGYNPTQIDENTGKPFSSQYVEEARVTALAEAFFTGKLDTVYQTEFTRSLDKGVIIQKDASFSGEYSTFFGHSEGALLVKMENGDFAEKLIPLGAPLTDFDLRVISLFDQVLWKPQAMEDLLCKDVYQVINYFDRKIVKSKKDLIDLYNDKGMDYEDAAKRLGFWSMALFDHLNPDKVTGRLMLETWKSVLQGHYHNNKQEAKEEDSMEVEEEEPGKRWAKILAEAPQLTDEDYLWKK